MGGASDGPPPRAERPAPSARGARPVWRTPPPPPPPRSTLPELHLFCARTHRNRAEAPAARAEAPSAATRIRSDIFYTPSLYSNPKSRHRVVWVASRPSPRRDAGRCANSASLSLAAGRFARARGAGRFGFGPAGTKASARARAPARRARARADGASDGRFFERARASAGFKRGTDAVAAKAKGRA